MKKKIALLGFWQYLKLYFLNWMGRIIDSPFSFSLKLVDERIYLRAGTSDYDCFHQIFVFEEYAFLKGKRFETCLDMGANVGYTAIYLIVNNIAEKVHCFEPSNSNFEMLLRNTNKLPNVISHKIAIWESNQLLKIVQSGYGNGGEWAWAVKADCDGDIQGRDFNEIVREYSSPNTLIKMDIEGTEKNIYSIFQWVDNIKLLCVENHGKDAEDSFMEFHGSLGKKLDFSGELSILG